MWAESTSGCLSFDVPGQPQRIRQGETRRHANLWMQEVSKSNKFVTKEVGTSVNPADLRRKPMPKSKIEQLMGIMGYEFFVTD